MDEKCSCGRYARINHFGNLLCWECRAKKIKGSPSEGWRDQLTRQYCRDHNIHKMTREEQIAFMKGKGFNVERVSRPISDGEQRGLDED